MGKEQDEVDNSSKARKTDNNNSSFVINIPSYQEVLESSHRKTAPPSFSQAFSFVKNTEFYTPPPPPPAPLHSDPSPSTQSAPDRRLGQSDAVSSSSSPSSSRSLQCRNAILVSHRQKGNPLLKHIRNVKWNFGDVVGDYLLGQSCCALYLSLRYHLLHPDYLYYRIRELQKNFKLQIVLCHIDVEDVVKPLQEVTRTALLHDCTLLCGWSLEECGRYLETIKVYENKPADIIQGQMDTDYLSRLNHALTAVRHVNKTDVVTLGSTFGSLSHIMDASMDDLARCPGIGERKVKRLYDTFHEPFKRVVSSRPTVTETTVKDAAEASTVGEITEEKTVSDTSKGKKEEPEMTVKSALLAAFAKHSSKVGRKKMKTRGHIEGGTDTSAAGEARADDLSSTQKA